MPAHPLSESDVELASLDWLQSLGFATTFGPEIAPDQPGSERQSWADVVLAQRLRDALAQLNPDVPVEALDDAFRKVTTTHHPSLIANNRAFHRMLVDGVPVEYQRDGRTVHDQVWLVKLERSRRERLASGEPVHGD